MASHIFKLHSSLQFPPNKQLYAPHPVPTPPPLQFSSVSVSKFQQIHHLLLPKKSSHSSKILCSSLTNFPSSSPFSPPLSREDAILQAKTCLSSTLKKPLNNPVLLPRQKLRKQRQPRFRVEIPVVDDSPNSLSRLCFDFFADLPVTRKGARASILILWSDPTMAESAHQMFVESSARSPNFVVNSVLASVDTGTLHASDLAVFMSPKSSTLVRMRDVCDDLYPRPVVLFNPMWGYEKEGDFGKELGGFPGSFEVVYSFMGLEVRGILSRRKGVVFRCVRDGVLSGEEWLVFVEDEDNNGKLRVISRFKKRPAIGDVESVLYNLMAANSPVTKSVKFIRDLASNVTGKKSK